MEGKTDSDRKAKRASREAQGWQKRRPLTERVLRAANHRAAASKQVMPRWKPA
jgi:hypothetical protein